MQRSIHASTKQIRLALSGNGAGKTAALVNEAIWTAKGYHPYQKAYFKVPNRVIVTLDHPSKMADKWIPEIHKWFTFRDEQFKKDGKPYVNRIVLDNGSEIQFKFHEQPDMAFESMEASAFFYDEPPPRRIWIALMRGGREKGTDPKFMIAGTPLAQSWMRIEYLDPWANGELPDVDCFTFSTDVNKEHLNWDAQEKFFSRLSEQEKEVRRHGRFFDMEGLALGHLWDRKTHIVEAADLPWDKNWPCVVAVDPHPSKKHHAVLMGCDKGNNLYVLKEIALKQAPRQFARSLKEWYKDFRIIDINVDNYGSGEMTGGEGYKSFIQILNEEGVRARPTTHDDKKDEDFIDRIQAVLQIPDKPNNFGQTLPKLRVLNTCPGTIRDIENVQWQRDKHNETMKPKLEISNRDYLACVKYALKTNLSNSRTKSRVYYQKRPSSYGGKKKGMIKWR